MTDRLGIVYTPVEVVDFIIHSIDDLLKQEFGQSLGSEGVHIIDPFTGTGTFVTRLLQSGLISKEQLPHKYKHEIHANELVLLAYYIAAVNIEAVYHSLVGGEYQPFEGICLTDTFQLYEKDDLVSELLADNSDRRNRQKNLDIRVIMGNPPYSVGQKNGNDENENIKYESLDTSLRETYVKHSSGNPRSLYDSYIRAIRWASDRVGKVGIIGFISGNGFIDKLAMDGMRKCLAEEFCSIYILNLRGDIRKNMLSKGKAKEGGNIFGSGSMSGITISFLVKSSGGTEKSNIYYSDIGDDLSTELKLDRLADLKSVQNITQLALWEIIEPNESYDWINKRDLNFKEYLQVGDKKNKSSLTIFNNYSSGLKTCRDTWCYSFSKQSVALKMRSMISFYNSQIDSFLDAKKTGNSNVSDNYYIDSDSNKISWSYVLKKRFFKEEKGTFHANKIYQAQYRPYTTQWFYYDRMFNENQYLIRQIFPNGNDENLIFCLSGAGSRSGFSILMSSKLPDLEIIEKSQCFPLYLYEKAEDDSIEFGDGGDLFSAQPEIKSENGYTRKDGISDAGLAHFKHAYPDETLSKVDIFYYVYGLLHSQDYRDRYADNLSKELPRIPCVKTAKDFWHFSQAGRDLAELHINYETVIPYPVTLDCGKRSLKQLSNDDFRVTKMKLAKKGEKDAIIYNHVITVRDIPVEAYDYVVNGKPALEWVMERQVVKTDKKSGITNDANRYAIETMDNPAYPLELFQRVITVSLETMKIVRSLPVLEIDG